MNHSFGTQKQVLAVTDIASDLRIAINHTDGDTVHCSTPINGKNSPGLSDKVWQLAKTDGMGKILFPENAEGHPDSSYSFAASDIETLTFYEPS